MIAQYRTAQIYHEQGQWEKCLSVTGSILENKPKDKLFNQLKFIVGDSFYRLNKWEASIVLLKEFVDSNSSDEGINLASCIQERTANIIPNEDKISQIINNNKGYVKYSKN